MTYEESAVRLPDEFNGKVRLFPLPNLVMFPHVVQPLHIFEPRYRRMLEEALEGDQLITMASLQSGWESAYEERPPIHEQVCIGRVVAHTRLPEGTYNLALLGLKRATIQRELAVNTPFRQAEVVVHEDVYPAGGESRRSRLRLDLIDAFRILLADAPANQQQLAALLDGRLPLGVLADIIAFSVDLDTASKLQLLRNWNVETRSELLVRDLREFAGHGSGYAWRDKPFPPRFSEN